MNPPLDKSRNGDHHDSLRSRTHPRRTTLAFGLGLAVLGMAANSTHAGGVVSRCDEASLRAALAGGGKVTFDCSGTITLRAPLRIDLDTVVDGAGQKVQISGNSEKRIFDVTGRASLSLANLSLFDGLATGQDGTADLPPTDGEGGAVRIEAGNLTASSCLFISNIARGGRTVDAAFGAADGVGGAIFARDGSVRLVDCWFQSNRADGGEIVRDSPGRPKLMGTGRGGAIGQRQGQLVLTRTGFYGNSADGEPLPYLIFGSSGGAEGGAVWLATAGLSADLCQFNDNSANAAIGFRDNGTGDAFGGAISLGASDAGAVVANCSFLRNRAVGAIGWSRGSEALGGAIASLRALQCSKSSFSRNMVFSGVSNYSRPPARGGAIGCLRLLGLQECVFDSNQAVGANGIGNRGGPASDGCDALGGAVYAAGGASIQSGQFGSNSAVGGDGSMLVGAALTDGGTGKGGAIYSTGALSMANVAVYGNSAQAGSAFAEHGSKPGSAYGGAMLVSGGPFSGANLTVGLNHALPSAVGGTVDGDGILVDSTAVYTSLVDSLVSITVRTLPKP